MIFEVLNKNISSFLIKKNQIEFDKWILLLLFKCIGIFYHFKMEKSDKFLDI